MRQNRLDPARPPTPQVMLRHAHNPRTACRRRVPNSTFYYSRRPAMPRAPASSTFPPFVTNCLPPQPPPPRCPWPLPSAVQPTLRGDSFVPHPPRSPPLRSLRSCTQLCFPTQPLRAEPGVPNTRNGRSGGRTFILLSSLTAIDMRYFISCGRILSLRPSFLHPVGLW